MGSFGTTLGLTLQRDGGSLMPHRIDGAATHWSVPWPQWAARSDGKLCVAAALALADEISSYGGMACWDARGRAGLTLSISAALAPEHRGAVPSIEVGEELHIVSRKLKTGRQLGYMELEIWRGAPPDEAYYAAAGTQPVTGAPSATASSSSVPSPPRSSSSSSELLAVGRHSKMLAVPAPLLSSHSLFNMISHPSVYPVLQPPALRLFETLRPTVRPWPPAEPTSRAEIFPPLTPLEELAGPPSSTAPAAPLRVPGGGASNAPLSTYAAALSPAWSNVLGALHGGAACILGAQGAATAYAHACGGGGPPPAVRMMHVTLLSGLKCDGRPAVIEAVTSSAALGRAAGRMGSAAGLVGATARRSDGEEADMAGADGEASSIATMRHATDAGRGVECQIWWA